MHVEWSSRRVLVTGGSGFLGRAVLAALANRGCEGVVTPTSADCDLRDRSAVSRLFADVKPDLVLHLAAEVGGIGANQKRPGELYLDNLLMTTYVIDEARLSGTDRIVVPGSVCSYPKFAPLPFSEDSLWQGYPEETNAPYGIAKLAALVQLRANRLQFGQRGIYVILTNLYGPGDKFHPGVSHVIPALIKKCVDAKLAGAGHIEVWGTGTASRDFLYVDDAAEGLVAAAEDYDSPDPINLGGHQETPIHELVRLIADLTGFDGAVQWNESKPDGQPRRWVDFSRATNAFGFRPSIDLEEGLRRTIDWYLQSREEAEARAGIAR